VRKGNSKDIFYDLTPKGWDAVPILTAFTYFGFLHHADVVFKDGKPRTLSEVLPNAQRELLGGLCEYALNPNLRLFTHSSSVKQKI
jgi:hypothetical protein